MIFICSLDPHLLSNQAIDIDQATDLSKKMQKGSFDFNDFLTQSQAVKNIGGMGGIFRMMPGIIQALMTTVTWPLTKIFLFVNRYGRKDLRRPNL